MQEIIDFIFSSYRWYRKLIGGQWYKISVPAFDGNKVMWIRASKLNPNFKWTVKKSEEYKKSDNLRAKAKDILRSSSQRG